MQKQTDLKRPLVDLVESSTLASDRIEASSSRLDGQQYAIATENTIFSSFDNTFDCNRHNSLLHFLLLFYTIFITFLSSLKSS